MTTDHATETSAGKDNDEIWKDDLLNRRADAEFLRAFLLERTEERRSAEIQDSYVLNINAAWGEGKTFFLQRFGKSLEQSGYLVASVNAWADDHADDPLLPVMAAIDLVVQNDSRVKGGTKKVVRKLGQLTGQVVAAGAKGFLKQTAKRYLGDEADDITKMIGGDDALAAVDKMFDKEAEALLAKFQEGKKTIERFKASLADFVAGLRAEKRAPLFVLVDELDRCRPPYAVSLLERIKHLFDIEDVVFVVATNTEQLQHSVGAIYGSAFDGSKYLSCFFSRTYQFEKPSRAQFVAEMLRRHPIDKAKVSLPPKYTIESFVSGAFDYCGLSLRDAQRVYDMLRSVVTSWTLSSRIELVVALPLIILEQQKTSSRDFNDEFSKLSDKYSGDRSAWHVEFDAVRLPSQPHSIQNVLVPQLATWFMGHASHALPNLPTPHDGASRWMFGRLHEEFQTLHHGRYVQDNPPQSVLRKYQEYVRSSGRLIPSVHPPIS